MGGNGNELSGIVWEWEQVSQCINFGNGNGNDHVGMGGIGNTERNSRTPLVQTKYESSGGILYSLQRCNCGRW